MKRTTSILLGVALALGICFECAAETIQTPEDARAYCELSKPAAAEASETADDYEERRRKLVHRPQRVRLSVEQLPAVQYDRITGLLTVGVYGDVPLFADFALDLGRPKMLQFEMSGKRARDLIARYRTGHARIEVSFLPVAYARYDENLCEPPAADATPRAKTSGTPKTANGKEVRDEADSTRLKGELLAAQFVDEVGQPLATYQTALGHEVKMMRAHQIRGYLDSTLPTVSVTSLVPYQNHDDDAPPETTRVRMASDLQKSLYGCYVRGLSENARLQGALVVKFAVGEGSKPQVLVDSLHHGAVTSCCLERVKRIAATRRTPIAPGTTFKATVIFKLQDPRSL